jgi:hypothetical protein
VPHSALIKALAAIDLQAEADSREQRAAKNAYAAAQAASAAPPQAAPQPAAPANYSPVASADQPQTFAPAMSASDPDMQMSSDPAMRAAQQMAADYERRYQEERRADNLRVIMPWLRDLKEATSLLQAADNADKSGDTKSAADIRNLALEIFLSLVP